MESKALSGMMFRGKDELVLVSTTDTCDAMSLDRILEDYHRATDAFSRGDPGPVMELYSATDDVTLASPFGPPVTAGDKS